MKIALFADKVLDWITVLLEYLMGFLMTSLVILTFMEVVLRYVFNSPTSWSSELSRFLLIWMTFTGAAVVTRYATHLSMGFTIHRFVGPAVSRIIKICVNSCIIITMVIIGYYGLRIASIAGQRIAPMTGLRMYVPWASMPFSAFVMALYLIASTAKLIANKEALE